MAKKSKRTSSSSPSLLLLVLPEELLVEVLLKLPVESLIVLRGVCKLFDTYISSKYLRGSHVQLWANRVTKMKHVFLKQDFAPDDHDPVSRGKRLCSEFAKSALDFRRPRNCRFLFEEDYKFKLQFGGCYDGILCFYEFWRNDDTKKVEDLVIYICNPALNECKDISRPRELMHSKSMTKVCFAPDPASGDYKIIVVSVSKYGHVGSKVYVFRLSDCCWRKIDTSNASTGPSDCEKDFSRTSDLVVHNGSVYWMSNYENYYNVDYNMLNVLDLQQESVGEIVLSDYLRKKFIPREDYVLLRHPKGL